jgi:hypothetical protein
MWRIWLKTLVLLTLTVSSALAVEVAPRISDREIIESLAELKVGRKGLQQQIGDFRESPPRETRDFGQELDQRFRNVVSVL